MIKTIYALCICAVASLVLAQQTPHYLLTSTPRLDADETLTGELNLEDGQNFKDGARLDMVKMYLDENQVIELSLSAESFDTYLTVFDAGGNLIASNDDSAETSNSAVVFVAQESGRYMLVVSGYTATDLGAYTLSATEHNVVDDGELTIPDGISGILETEDDDLGGRYLDAFTINLEEKATVSIAMMSDALDSYLIVLDAAGSTIAENDDDEYSLNAYLELELAAGDYTIWATTNSTDDFGFYELMLNRLD